MYVKCVKYEKAAWCLGSCLALVVATESNYSETDTSHTSATFPRGEL